MCFNLSIISNHIFSFYRELYANTSLICSCLLDIDSLIPSIVTDAENSSLMAILSFEKIKVAVFLWIGIVLWV